LIAKLSYGHLCMREENLRFNNDIHLLWAEAITTRWMIPPGTNSLLEDISPSDSNANVDI
jgi:hypothetical protein